MRRGNYGYDAPYALLMFGSLAAVSALCMVFAWWRMSPHAARIITLYFVLLLANTASFFYTTRRGKFLEWESQFQNVMPDDPINQVTAKTLLYVTLHWKALVIGCASRPLTCGPFHFPTQLSIWLFRAWRYTTFDRMSIASDQSPKPFG